MGGGKSTSSPAAEFAKRMKAAVAPLNDDLNKVAQDISAAGDLLEACKASASEFEAASSSRSGPALGRGPTFAEARSSVMADLGKCRFGAGVEQAWEWHCQHLDHKDSLVEV